jgi:hypothetical protein
MIALPRGGVPPYGAGCGVKRLKKAQKTSAFFI